MICSLLNRAGVWSFAGLLTLAAVPCFVGAAELLPPESDPAVVIDHYIDAKLQAGGVTPAPPADDSALLRRTLLDLEGRIPTTSEAQAYLANKEPTKRTALVDAALASPRFVRHQVEEFDVMLSGLGKGNLKQYLTLAMTENRPWDQIFRELLLAEEATPAQAGAKQFLKARVTDLDRLANETSVIFFGVNISCAKCHDHPLVKSWTQEHFYGMASFFSRTFEHGDFLGERGYGRVDYQTTSGENRTAKLMFLTGTHVEEPETAEPKEAEKKAEKELLEKLKKEKQAPPAPSFSRRAKLVEIALQPEQRHYFAKAIVNQLWNRLFGYGLVMPIDQMHPENPPSHPELMDWLARDLVDHQYDLKRLMRGMVLSNAYARSSRWEANERPAASLFAVANVRALTPPQYAAVLGVGSASPSQFPADLKADDFDNRLRGAIGPAQGVVEKLEHPGANFQVSVDEALLLANSERVMRDVLRDKQPSLLQDLRTLPDRRAALEMAIWNTLSRPPVEEELQMLDSYLARRNDRVEVAWQQLVWALLTSTEARFNY